MNEYILNKYYSHLIIILLVNIRYLLMKDIKVENEYKNKSYLRNKEMGSLGIQRSKNI